MRVEDEMFEKVFGQSVEETSKETCEEGVTSRGRRVEAAPSRKEVEEHTLDHAVFRSWCPHRVKGRAEAYGHKKRMGGRRRRSTNGVAGLHAHA